MLTKQDLQTFGPKMIYLKPVATADLPDEVRAEAGELETLFAVHNNVGEQVALVADRRIASHLAKEHKMELVSLH